MSAARCPALRCRRSWRRTAGYGSASKVLSAAPRPCGSVHRANVRSRLTATRRLLLGRGGVRLSRSTLRPGTSSVPLPQPRRAMQAIQPSAARVGQQGAGSGRRASLTATTTPERGRGIVGRRLAGDGHRGQRQSLVDDFADARQRSDSILATPGRATSVPTWHDRPRGSPDTRRRGRSG